MIPVPRPHLVRSDEFPYHVTARSNNRESFPIPVERCWEIFKKNLIRLEKRFNFQTHLFVMMDNHFHWIVDTPKANLDLGMATFMTQSSKEIGQAAGRINKIYGGRYSRSLITNEYYYLNAFRYVMQNPIRAGLTNDYRNYRWHTWHKTGTPRIQHEFLQLLPPAGYAFEQWANTIPSKTLDEQIRKGLKKARFEITFPKK